MRVAQSMLVVTLAALAAPASAQLPLGQRSGSGLTVTPAYEGWYENADGTLSMSFGYMNRNFEEVIEIPLGPENRIEPAEFQGAQPTLFAPRRHWGVFVVRVPPDFGDRKVWWTLEMRGQTFRVPGHLHPDWKIDALKGEAGGGNEPPEVRFGPSDPAGRGPAGAWGGPLHARIGVPLDVTVWARDDGRGGGSVYRGPRDAAPVRLTWFKHQGPGDVHFDEPTAEVAAVGGSTTARVTFSEPGDYVLRVRANDASGVASAGHAQCCWTNGFVRVRVEG